jgi:hypothetical protein
LLIVGTRKFRTVWVAAFVAATHVYATMTSAAATQAGFVARITVNEAELVSMAALYQCVEQFTESEVEVLKTPDPIFTREQAETAWKIGNKGFVAKSAESWLYRKSSDAEITPCNPTVTVDGIPSYTWELRNRTSKAATFRIFTRRCGDHLYLATRVRLSIVRADGGTRIGLALSGLPNGKKYPCIRRAIDITLLFDQRTSGTFSDVSMFPWSQ